MVERDEEPSRRWEDGLRCWNEFTVAHGHGRVPRGYRCPEHGLRLGRWVEQCRSERRLLGVADPRSRFRAQLHVAVLGSDPMWSWSGEGSSWDMLLSALTRFVATHDRLPAEDDEGEVWLPVGAWAARQQREFRAARLTASCVQALERVPGWQWATVAHPSAGMPPRPERLPNDAPARPAADTAGVPVQDARQSWFALAAPGADAPLPVRAAWVGDPCHFLPTLHGWTYEVICLLEEIGDLLFDDSQLAAEATGAAIAAFRSSTLTDVTAAQDVLLEQLVETRRLAVAQLPGTAEHDPPRVGDVSASGLPETLAPTAGS